MPPTLKALASTSLGVKSCVVFLGIILKYTCKGFMGANVCAVKCVCWFHSYSSLSSRNHVELLTKRACPMYISVLSQPSSSIFKSPFLLKAFPNSDFGSPLDLTRSSFCQCLGGLWMISSSLTSVLAMCTSLPKTLNFLQGGHFTPHGQEAEVEQVYLKL